MTEENQAPSDSGLTLTQATHFGRLAVKYGGLFIVVLVVGRIFLRSLVAILPTCISPVGLGAIRVRTGCLTLCLTLIDAGHYTTYC